MEKALAADSAEAADALTNWTGAGDALLRQYCADVFADAQHGSSADIPYPDNRQEDGYLPEGEFLYEDAEQGLWAYVSDTLQVEIIRWEQPEIPPVLSATSAQAEAESIHPQDYFNATFPGRCLPPRPCPDRRVVFGIQRRLLHLC